MRPWRGVIETVLPDSETVYLYQPARWMEYGMQFYRFNKTRSIYTPEELASALEKTGKTLIVADEKGMLDIGEAGADIQVLETVGNQTAFWSWNSR